METFLAILMVLGIYIVAPSLIGLLIVGVVMLTSRRAQRAERANIVAEAEALATQHTETAGAAATEKATTEEVTKVPVTTR